MAHVMVDIETLGTSPGSIILSIGAVAFDHKGLYERTFHQVIYEPSSREANLTADPATLRWWADQTPEAKTLLDKCQDSKASLPLRDVFISFNRFLEDSGLTVLKSQDGLWGNGSDFDNVLLWSAFQAAKIKPAWKYHQNRCYRTLKNLCPYPEIVRSGTHHDTLTDARDQAEHAVKLLTLLGEGLACIVERAVPESRQRILNPQSES